MSDGQAEKVIDLDLNASAAWAEVDRFNVARTPDTLAPPATVSRGKLWDRVSDLRAALVNASPEERAAYQSQLDELKSYLAVPGDKQAAPPPAMPADSPVSFATVPVSAEAWMRQQGEAREAKRAAALAETERLRGYRESRGVPRGFMGQVPGRTVADVHAEQEAARVARKEAARVERQGRIDSAKARGKLGHL